MRQVLVINSGSSSIKYQLLDLSQEDEPNVMAAGLVERIGEPVSTLTHTSAREGQSRELVIERHMAGHAEGFAAMDEAFSTTNDLADGIVAVGHRVVHGGDSFAAPAVIDDAVLDAIRDCIPLAPLHNPANLLGIETAMAAHPDVPHVAVFDTAYHQTMPPEAFTYAIELDTARRLRVRRYGFHGTSHAYVARRVSRAMGRDPLELDVVSLHLGNGASACAIRHGISVDTSMGMTPLAGLVMGSRTGDLDPGVVFHLIREGGMSVDEVDALLNSRSGMRGLCDENDLRAVHARIADGDETARSALAVYVHRIKQYLGAYVAVLNGADAIVFTAGVGENDARVRALVCEGLDWLGIELDTDVNESTRGPSKPILISSPSSRVQVWVVPTNEEREIATQALAAVN